MIYEYNIKEAHSLQNLFVIFEMYKKCPLNLILAINLNSGFQRILNCPRFLQLLKIISFNCYS